MAEEIEFGSKRIAYELSFSKRKTLGISVDPNMKVRVAAPETASTERIRKILRKRAPWILRQQNYFLSFHPKTPRRKFVSGETHLYLGRQYRLRILLGKKIAVHCRGRFIEVTVKSKVKAKEQMTKWYRESSKVKFAEIADPLIQQFKKYKVEPTGIYIQQMPTRWGSCTPTGKIILNPELIKAPKRCIEYVIIHELCHLVHHDHTQKFFDLQKKMMPDWERWKGKLENLLA